MHPHPLYDAHLSGDHVCRISSKDDYQQQSIGKAGGLTGFPGSRHVLGPCHSAWLAENVELCMLNIILQHRPMIAYGNVDAETGTSYSALHASYQLDRVSKSAVRTEAQAQVSPTTCICTPQCFNLLLAWIQGRPSHRWKFLLMAAKLPKELERANFTCCQMLTSRKVPRGQHPCRETTYLAQGINSPNPSLSSLVLCNNLSLNMLDGNFPPTIEQHRLLTVWV